MALSIRCTHFLVLLCVLCVPECHSSEYFDRAVEDLDRCARVLGETEEFHMDSLATLDMNNVYNSLQQMEDTADQNLNQVENIIKSLKVSQNIDMLNNTMDAIDLLLYDVANDSTKVEDEDVENCLKQEEQLEDVAQTWTKWLPDRRRPRKVNGELGAKRIQQYDACEHLNTRDCYISGMVFLPNGYLALMDISNYAVHMFDIRGIFKKSVSLFPLVPSFITHYRDYVVLVKATTLDGHFVIVQVNLFDGSSRVLIDLGYRDTCSRFCTAENAVVGGNIVISCLPLVIVYDDNGTILRNYTTVSAFRSSYYFGHTEEGARKILWTGPALAFNTSSVSRNSSSVSETRLSDSFLDTEICKFEDLIKTGVVDRNGAIYGVQFEKVYRYYPNCTREGVAIEHKLKTIRLLAVQGNRLAVMLNENRGQNSVFVYQF